MDEINISQYLNWLAIVANIIVLFGGWYILLKKAKPEIASETAQAAEAYANITKIYSEELSKVRSELKDLRKELDAKDKIIYDRDRIIDDRDAIILNQKTIIDDVTDWAERLVHQVKSFGETPVPLRSNRPKKIGDK